MRASTVVRDSFVAGLVLIAPLVVTVIVLRIAFNWLAGFVDPVVSGVGLARYTANIQLVAQVLTLVLLVITILVLGYLAQMSLGRRAFGWLGRLITFVPLVRTIYGSTRQVANALVTRNSRYESVVLVEYPREDHFVIGFVTGESPRPVSALADEACLNVFLPNSPNPTGGRLLLVPESRVHEVDLAIRRGLQLLVTTGMSAERAIDDPEARPPDDAPSPT